MADYFPVIFFVAIAGFVGTGLWRLVRVPAVKLAQEADRIPLAEQYCGAMFGGSKSATWPFVRLAAYEDVLVIVCEFFRGAVPYSTISAWAPEQRLGSPCVRFAALQLPDPATLWIRPDSRLFRIVATKIESERAIAPN